MFSENKNIAQLDLSDIARSRIQADLNVKGLVTAPDKLDCRAIIPTYDMMGRHTNIVERWSARNVDLTVPGNEIAPLIDMADARPQFTKAKLLGYYATIYLDIAGRAALVAATEPCLNIQIRKYINDPFFIIYEYGTWIFELAANVGGDGFYNCGSHFIPNEAAGSLFPAPNWGRVDHSIPIEITSERPGNLYAEARTRSGGGFPAGSLFNVSSVWEWF